MSAGERDELIARYEAGPEMVRAAYERVPEEARKWRPAPGEWSAHEVIVHCADSETTSSSRIRYVLAETEPVIVGYDQEGWAVRFDYHALPIEPALAAVAATRASTAALLRSLPEDAWSRFGRHSESGRYSAEDWLRIYAVHLHDHAAQIEANIAAWESSRH